MKLTRTRAVLGLVFLLFIGGAITARMLLKGSSTGRYYSHAELRALIQSIGPEQLKNAISLLKRDRNTASFEASPQEWGPEIKKLRPLRVYVDREGAQIILFKRFVEFQGLVIQLNERTQGQQNMFPGAQTEQIFPGIYWYFDPG